MLVRLPTVRGLSGTKTSGTQNFRDFGDEGQETDRMKLDGAVMTRAARLFFLLLLSFGTDVNSAGTVLSAVHDGNIWRVQITWPNGSVRYFGRFPSEKDAHAWINAHAWLTVPVTKETASPKDDVVSENGE